MIKLSSEVAFVFGTVLLIIISIAWVEFIALIRTVITKNINPLLSQFIFTLIITLIGILLLWKIQPLTDSITDVNKALKSERTIITKVA